MPMSKKEDRRMIPFYDREKCIPRMPSDEDMDDMRNETLTKDDIREWPYQTGALGETKFSYSRYYEKVCVPLANALAKEKDINAFGGLGEAFGYYLISGFAGRIIGFILIYWFVKSVLFK